MIRFTVTSARTTVDDIVKDWIEIKKTATTVLGESEEAKPRAKVPLGGKYNIYIYIYILFKANLNIYICIF